MYLGLASLKFVHMVPKLRIFSEHKMKTKKIAKSLKILSVSAAGELKPVIIRKRSFLKFVRGNFL
jgi:hypothetical protein